MEEDEGENLVAKTDDQDASSDTWKRSLSDLEEVPELESDKLGIQEDMVERVMKWLELEIASTSPSSSSSYPQETEFITINGNEETCGSSFSGTSSSVMASIDTRYEAPYLGSMWPFAGAELGEVASAEEVIVGEFGEVSPTEEEVVVGEDAEGLVDDDWMDFIDTDDFMEVM